MIIITRDPALRTEESRQPGGLLDAQLRRGCYCFVYNFLALETNGLVIKPLWKKLINTFVSADFSILGIDGITSPLKRYQYKIYLSDDIHKVQRAKRCNCTTFSGKYGCTVLLLVAWSCDQPCDKCRNYLGRPKVQEKSQERYISVGNRHTISCKIRNS